MVASPSDSSVDDKIRQMVAMLDDPDVGEAVKLTIRDGLQKLAQGGFDVVAVGDGFAAMNSALRDRVLVQGHARRDDDAGPPPPTVQTT